MTPEDQATLLPFERALLNADPLPDAVITNTDKQKPEADIQPIITRMIEEAVQWYEEHLEPDQTEATDYYYGRAFGNEEDGRSQVVSTVVRDATLAQMPTLMRIFCGPERYVEFRARGPEDEASARQATDYVNYVLMNDNNGYLILRGGFKDALVRRIGAVKWWWDKFSRATTSEMEGVDEQGLMLLVGDQTLTPEIMNIRQTEAGPLFDMRVVRRDTEGVARVVGIPSEELVWTPDATDLDSAPLVAHVREVPRDELVALGIEPSVLDELESGRRRVAKSDSLEAARRIDNLDTNWREDERDKSQKGIIYAEAYVLIDTDGDGIAERRLFQCVGSDYKIVNGLGEPVDEVPFAMFISDPEPHVINGLSNWDLLKDLQLIDSQILRGVLDSLAKAIEPDEEVVTNEVNMQDVLSTERGKIIRVRRPGMMREITHSFLGVQALDVLNYTEQLKENRVGVSKAAAGLDADSLQSATKAAVAATLSAAQQRIELIARDFAETGMRRLYRGLLKLIHKHQPRERMVRLRNQWVPIDPRYWDADMDVTVNIALGQGTPEDKIIALEKIIGAQTQLMQVGAPLVTWVETRNSLGRAIELAGWRNTEEFVKPWGPEQQQQYEQQMAQQPPQQDPAALLAEVEKMKIEVQSQMDQMKLQLQAQTEQNKAQLEQQKLATQDARERDKIASQSEQERDTFRLEAEKAAADAMLKQQELEMRKRETEARIREINARIELMKAQAAAKTQEAEPEEETT